MAENNDDVYDTRTILKRMREEYWRGVSEEIEEEAQDQVQLLSFILGGENFAIHAIYGKEIIKMPRVVRVPGTSSSLLGIINLRGTITPIIDVRSPLGLKTIEVGEDGRAIITQLEDIHTGILVERIVGITQAPRDDITPVSSTLAKKDYLEGQILMDDGKPLVILNIEKLLNAPDFRATATKK